jgi:glycosyltransferase
MIALRFLGRHKISTCYIPEVLIKMRVGGASNRSISNILRKSSEDLRAMKMHNIGGLPTLLRKNLSKLPQFFKKT